MRKYPPVMSPSTLRRLLAVLVASSLLFVIVMYWQDTVLSKYRYIESIALRRWNYNYRICRFKIPLDKMFGLNPAESTANDKHIKIQPNHSLTTKIILQWTLHWGDREPETLILDENELGRKRPCLVTSNRSAAAEADAVNFWIHDFCLSDVPPAQSRNLSQRYIFGNIEPPTFQNRDLSLIEPGFFNWTMTFRLDSDIPTPYFIFHSDPHGSTSKKQMPTLEYYSSLVANKTKSVAWFVSNCFKHSNRDALARALQAFIPVDIYGACGTLSCPKSRGTACNEMLTRDYRFYLALENSICKDYVTEKFWRTLDLDVVPIVFKRAMYETIAPHHSFIAIDDFKSIQELANHLKVLEIDTDEYLKYFEWKTKSYSIVELSHSDYYKKICRKLWLEADKGIIGQSYADIIDWWSMDAYCDSQFVNNFLRG